MLIPWWQCYCWSSWSWSLVHFYFRTGLESSWSRNTTHGCFINTWTCFTKGVISAQQQISMLCWWPGNWYPSLPEQGLMREWENLFCHVCTGCNTDFYVRTTIVKNGKPALNHISNKEVHFILRTYCIMRYAFLLRSRITFLISGYDLLPHFKSS